jgi:hypothetical protein
VTVGLLAYGERVSGHVFISYSRTDTAYVERLAAHLQAAGVPVWVDHEIDYGDRWASVIEAEISSCVAFVPVMTPAAGASEWVEREIHFAQQLGRPILPLLLAGQPFFRLATTQHEDVTSGAMPTPAFVARLGAITSSAATAYSTAAQALLAAGSLLWSVDLGTAYDVVHSPSGREVASSDLDRIWIWDEYGRRLRTIDIPGVYSVAYSPGGYQVAAACEDGSVKLIEAHTGEITATLSGHDGTVHCVAYSPDGRRLATAGHDVTARIWDILRLVRPQRPAVGQYRPGRRGPAVGRDRSQLTRRGYRSLVTSRAGPSGAGLVRRPR